MKWQIAENRVPTRAEVKHLTKSARERADAAKMNFCRQPIVDWAVLHCLIGSGLRSHEIADLQVGDLRIGHGESSIIVRHGKGDKPRVVAISERLKRHLQQFLAWKKLVGENTESDAPVFASERGGRFCTRGIRHLFKRVLKRAGLSDRYGVHSLRHFHLSALYQATNDLRLTQDQAGHASISTTQVYTHVSLERRREAVEKIF
jgi:site-specific recombinase XerD